MIRAMDAEGKVLRIDGAASIDEVNRNILAKLN